MQHPHMPVNSGEMGAERLIAWKHSPCSDTGPVKWSRARGAVSVGPIWHAFIAIRPTFREILIQNLSTTYPNFGNNLFNVCQKFIQNVWKFYKICQNCAENSLKFYVKIYRLFSKILSKICQNIIQNLPYFYLKSFQNFIQNLLKFYKLFSKIVSIPKNLFKILKF